MFAFAKTPSDALASLAKKLDKVVAENETKRMAAVINFTGTPSDEYRQQIAEFGKKNDIQHVALTVTGDADRFNVSDSAEFTVMHYLGKEVKFNHAVAADGLDEETVNAIVAGTKKILE